MTDAHTPSSMTEELKPCPFCGGEAEIDEIEGGIGALFFASCKDDDCCGYRIDPWVKCARRIEAAQHWNQRANTGAVDELVKAVRRWNEAKKAFHQFERDNPNNSTKAWDAVFDEVCFAEDAMRNALAALGQKP